MATLFLLYGLNRYLCDVGYASKDWLCALSSEALNNSKQNNFFISPKE